MVSKFLVGLGLVFSLLGGLYLAIQMDHYDLPKNQATEYWELTAHWNESETALPGLAFSWWAERQVGARVSFIGTVLDVHKSPTDCRVAIQCPKTGIILQGTAGFRIPCSATQLLQKNDSVGISCAITDTDSGGNPVFNGQCITFHTP